MNATKELFYATVGVGDLAVEKARKTQEKLDLPRIRELPKSLTDIRSEAGKTATQTIGRISGQYQVLVKRGEKTVKAIRNSAGTKRPAQRAKSAHSQTKTVEATKVG